jgi:hypothetical protein
VARAHTAFELVEISTSLVVRGDDQPGARPKVHAAKPVEVNTAPTRGASARMPVERLLGDVPPAINLDQLEQIRSAWTSCWKIRRFCFMTEDLVIQAPGSTRSSAENWPEIGQGLMTSAVAQAETADIVQVPVECRPTPQERCAPPQFRRASILGRTGASLRGEPPRRREGPSALPLAVQRVAQGSLVACCGRRRFAPRFRSPRSPATALARRRAQSLLLSASSDPSRSLLGSWATLRPSGEEMRRDRPPPRIPRWPREPHQQTRRLAENRVSTYRREGPSSRPRSRRVAISVTAGGVHTARLEVPSRHRRTQRTPPPCRRRMRTG